MSCQWKTGLASTPNAFGIPYACVIVSWSDTILFLFVSYMSPTKFIGNESWPLSSFMLIISFSCSTWSITMLPVQQAVSSQDLEDRWLKRQLFLTNHHPQSAQEYLHLHFPHDHPVQGWILKSAKIMKPVKSIVKTLYLDQNCNLHLIKTHTFVAFVCIEVDWRIRKSMSNRNQISFPESSKTFFIDNTWCLLPHTGLTQYCNTWVHALYLRIHFLIRLSQRLTNKGKKK